MRVYAAFRLCGPQFLDFATAWVAGGPQVHCELVVQRDGNFETYGSLYPDGVSRSNVLRSTFYGILDTSARPLTRERAIERGLTWQWLDITDLVGADGGIEQWMQKKVGMSYRTGIFLDYVLPVRVSGTQPKTSYICSELLAESILVFAGAKTPALRSALDLKTMWGAWPLCRQQGLPKLSPAALHSVLSECQGVTAMQPDEVVAHVRRTCMFPCGARSTEASERDAPTP